MNNYISKLTPDQVCSLCHSSVEFHCVQVEIYSYDFWYFCTNKNCSNYHGEESPYTTDQPNWLEKTIKKD